MTYCDSRVWELTGFQDTELLGQSVYKYYYTPDYLKLIQAHCCLLSKGQVTAGKYRFLLKHGGYSWAETEASVVYDNQIRQPHNILCINYLLKQPEVVFSQEQMEHSLKPRGLRPGTAMSPLLADEAGQKTETQAEGLPLLFSKWNKTHRVSSCLKSMTISYLHLWGGLTSCDSWNCSHGI
ncbi:hypothetical protein ACEWY4_009538 [Coilia grayii]|uniref:PAS domain-containing protein n=1 Tax=Coilia grayii TaxID=363190 RepID=A0ABD1K6T3_9TELE